MGALGQFLEAVEDGVVAAGSFLLVENLDRLTRDQIVPAQMLFLQIINAGITIVTLADDRSYSKESVNNNPTDLIISLLTMIRAHEESATKGRRLKALWEQKRKNAAEIPMTAQAPAWLKLDKTLSPPRWRALQDRAKVVQRIYKMAAEGIGQHSIAAVFNKEEVPTFGKSKVWHRSYIKKILNNEAVIGVFTPHTVTHDAAGRKIRSPQEPVPGYYPAVVDKELFDNVRAMQLEGRRQPSTKKSRPAHMLAGLAKCGRCGATMTRVFKGAGNGKPTLVCTAAKVGRGCSSYEPVRVEDVEAAIRRNINFLIGTAPLGDETFDSQWDTIATAIGVTQDMIENVVDAIAKNGSTPALEKRLADLERALEASQKERDRLLERAMTASRQSVTKRFDSLEALIESGAEAAEVNAVMRQLVSSVTVDNIEGYITFNWSHGGESNLMFSWPTTSSSSTLRRRR